MFHLLRAARLGLALPSRTLTVSAPSGGQGVPHTSRGVLLDVAKPGSNAVTRNDARRWAMRAGDAALFSRGELDPGFGNRPALLACEEDERPFPAWAVGSLVEPRVFGGP